MKWDEAFFINYVLSNPQPHTSLGSNLSSVGSESNLEQFVSPHFLTWNRANRSNSWSEAAIPTADDAAAAAASNVIDRHRDRDSSREADEDGERVAVNWSELLDPDQAELYESLKMVYANILMNWGLLTGQEKKMWKGVRSFARFRR